MRFGISATSLMCPKNLRTRLRPVNVCCAIVASHFRRPCGRTFRSATAIAPGLNFESLERNKAQFQELSPESVLQTFKTQNDARAHDCTRPSQLAASRTEKARNLTVSQRLTPGTLPSPTAYRIFLLPLRYGAESWRFEGLTPRIPTL